MPEHAKWADISRSGALARSARAHRKRGVQCSIGCETFSPDIEDARLEQLIAVLLEAHISGIIACNTTSQRSQLQHVAASERGGLSGRPLFAPSTHMLATIRRMSGGAVPLIGVGGISSGADAYAKIRAGACALQLYTALIYAGTALVPRIERELAALLRRDGFASIADAVGIDTS